MASSTVWHGCSCAQTNAGSANKRMRRTVRPQASRHMPPSAQLRSLLAVRKVCLLAQEHLLLQAAAAQESLPLRSMRLRAACVRALARACTCVCSRPHACRAAGRACVRALRCMRLAANMRACTGCSRVMHASGHRRASWPRQSGSAVCGCSNRDRCSRMGMRGILVMSLALRKPPSGAATQATAQAARRPWRAFPVSRLSPLVGCQPGMRGEAEAE